jgi:hypothetical protein
MMDSNRTFYVHEMAITKSDFVNNTRARTIESKFHF